jgi:hypothetical protein
MGHFQMTLYDGAVTRAAWHEFLHIENRLASLIDRSYMAHRIELIGSAVSALAICTKPAPRVGKVRGRFLAGQFACCTPQSQPFRSSQYEIAMPGIIAMH